MPDDQIKDCRKCKHYAGQYLCSHTDTSRRHRIDPVTGQKTYDDHYLCSIRRTYGACGREAKHFVKASMLDAVKLWMRS